MENIPSGEAKHKKNRCNRCFDCPCCQHTLSARATTVSIPKTEKTEGEGDSKVITKKIYYLACLACRWTTRDVGIPDQTTAVGSWPECEYRNAQRFSILLEHFQAVVLQEKQEKQEYWRRKAPKPNKFPSITDRTGITVSMIRRQMGYSDKSQAKIKPSSINPSIATDVVEPLPDYLFKQELSLKNITTTKQRLAQPSGQPYTVNKLFPQHKSLSIKRSLRCRNCEHNVMKPEYNPGSIKYRIQLFASHHIPEVRLIKSENFRAGVNATITLKLINPTMHDMTLTIMELPTDEEESFMIDELRKGIEKSVSVSTPSVTSSISRQASLNEEPRFVDKNVTGQIVLPDSSFILLHQDDSTEYDEDVQSQREDPK